MNCCISTTMRLDQWQNTTLLQSAYRWPDTSRQCRQTRAHRRPGRLTSRTSSRPAEAAAAARCSSTGRSPAATHDVNPEPRIQLTQCMCTAIAAEKGGLHAARCMPAPSCMTPHMSTARVRRGGCYLCYELDRCLFMFAGPTGTLHMATSLPTASSTHAQPSARPRLRTQHSVQRSHSSSGSTYTYMMLRSMVSIHISGHDTVCTGSYDVLLVQHRVGQNCQELSTG
jgi:hypothetical protein